MFYKRTITRTGFDSTTKQNGTHFSCTPLIDSPKANLSGVMTRSFSLLSLFLAPQPVCQIGE